MPGVVREDLRCEGIERRMGNPCRNAGTHVWQGGWYCRWHGDPARRMKAVRSHHRFVWTDDRLEQLYRFVEAGVPDSEIGRRMGCSGEAAQLARKRHGIASRARLTISARDVAKLLGKRCAKSVVRWIEAGWLRGRRGYVQGPHAVWLVWWKDLETFVADERYWVAWEPDRVTHPVLVAAARRPAWARFLTHAEVAARCCVERGTVGAWIGKGWLRAIQYGNWFVREDWLLEFQRRWSYGQRGAFAAVEDAA